MIDSLLTNSPCLLDLTISDLPDNDPFKTPTNSNLEELSKIMDNLILAPRARILTPRLATPSSVIRPPEISEASECIFLPSLDDL